MAHQVRLLQNRLLQATLISTLFSQAGIWVRNFAVLLYVMSITNGNALAVSLISVAEYAPIFIFSFVGGVFADRWRPKKTILWCEYLSSLSVFIVFFVLHTGSWQAVFFATFVSSILSQFAAPSGMKLIKQHIREEDVSICMSVLQTVSSVFMVIGPVLGTIVYQQLGMQWSILLTSGAFLLSALALFRIPPDTTISEHAGQTSPFSIWHEMKLGIAYIITKKELLYLSLCFMLVGLGVGAVSPLGMFIITERLGLPADQLQWMTVAYGAGEIVGGIVIFALAAKIAPYSLLLLGLFVNAAGILITGISNQIWLTVAAQFMTALLQPAIFIGNQSLVMKYTEQQYIGRITGIRTPLMTGSMLIMMSLSGVLKNVLSLPFIFGLASCCFIAGSVVLIPIFRKNDRKGMLHA